MQKCHEFDNIMLWAACCLAFFAFLRVGEFIVQAGEQFDPSTHLTPRDVEVDDLTKPSMLKVRIKRSKTDQWREGVDLHVFVGKTGNELCPNSWQCEDKMILPCLKQRKELPSLGKYW